MKAGGNGGEGPLYFTALLVPLVLIFYGLSSFGLLNNAEGMYAEIGREMLAGGDWLIPHLDGLPYIEKPPLLYWLLTLSMQIFGVSDLAVRLVPALSSTLTCALVAGFGARVAGRTYGAMAALVLGSCAGLLLMARIALADGLLTALLTTSWLLAYLALREERWLWWRLALVSLALALLTKGFVALVLFGLVGITHLWLNERTRWRKHLRLIADPWAWCLFLLIAVPWHWAATAAQPGFAWFYFINEHLLRFLGLREPRDYYSGSALYYLPRLALMTLPWLPLCALAIWTRRGQKAAQNDKALSSFLWVCVLAPLIFFSLSSAKANYYVVVCLPPLALLMARPMEQWWRSARPWRRLLLLLPALLMVPTELALLKNAGQAEADFSARAMAREISKKENLPVFLYQDFEDYSALPFYLGRPVGMIDSRSQDLHFALEQAQPAELFPSVDTFVRRTTPAYVVILDSRLRRPLPAELEARLDKQFKVGNGTLYHYPGARSSGE